MGAARKAIDSLALSQAGALYGEEGDDVLTGAGEGAAVHFATLSNKPGLKSTDFFAAAS